VKKINDMKKQKLKKRATRNKNIDDFIRESNSIERVEGLEPFIQAKKAWNYLKYQKYLTPNKILKIHKILMKDLRPDIAGRYRNCDVWIGGHVKPFISWQLINDDLENFCKDILIYSQDESLSPKSVVKTSHIQFENIHPFEDGNGRVGRLIMLWHRIQYRLPIEVIHADYDKGGDEQKNYYKWFR
jgi:Fic family protein